MTETQTAAASINQMFPAASHFGIYDSVFQIASNGPPSLNTSPIRLSSSSRALHLPSPSPPSSHGDGLQAGRPNHSSLVESELYARLLLPRKKGYPLWRPKPDERLPEECRREGVRIGDVGILNELGGFDFLFNCCLPEDHPVNSGRVPADFRQIQGINESDTTGSLREYGPASYVPSDPSDIHKITIPVPPGQPRIRGVPRQVGAGLTFTSTASKGALLILPEGGMRIDHQQYGKFYRYAAECARSWYAYINGPALDRGAPNGSIYLVTGCDKARAWGVASFTNARPENVSLEFVPGESEIEGGLPEYWFSKCSSAISSSDADDEFEQKSGCVFLRGFKIAVKPPIFMTGTKVGSRVEYISRLDADELVPKPRSNNFAIPVEPQWWLLPYIAPGLAGLASANFDSEEDSPEDEQALVKHRIYHPSDVINDWILSTNSKAEVAITHDDDWASVIEDGDHYIPGDKELIRRINERYQVLVARGYARIDRQEPSMKLSKFILNSNSLRRSYSEGSMNDPFQPKLRSKVIRRYASASTVLNRNEIPSFPAPEWLPHSPSASSVEDDVPRVIIWPPSPASRTPPTRPGDQSPVSRRRNSNASLRHSIDSPDYDYSPPFSPLSSQWDTSSNSNSISDGYSRPNSPHSSSSDKFEPLIEFSRKNDSSGSYPIDPLEYPHAWEEPTKHAARRSSIGDSLIPPIVIKHREDRPRKSDE